MKARATQVARRTLSLGRKYAHVVKARLLADRQLANFPAPRKLHLGSGTVRLPGWLNVDADRAGGADFAWDLRYGIPGQEASAELVFCEHFLEHLPPEAGTAFLKECLRVLVPGGVVRIAMPSLDHILGLVCAGNWRDQQWMRERTCPPIGTRAEMLNLVFRAWGHEWVYDSEELERRLRDAGFSQWRFCEWGQSSIPALKGLETRPDSLLICEAIKSA